MKAKSFLYIFFFLGSVLLKAQDTLDLPTQRYLADFQLEWIAPEATFKWRKASPQAYIATDFGLYLRKEKLEIRYLIEAIDSSSYLSDLPHLRAGQLAVHLADNSEDSHISGHELHPDSIALHYRADWAQLFTFRPKLAFSERRHCQMIALYREGVTRAFIFLLFDDPPISLPERKQSLRFTE